MSERDIVYFILQMLFGEITKLPVNFMFMVIETILVALVISLPFITIIAIVAIVHKNKR